MKITLLLYVVLQIGLIAQTRDHGTVAEEGSLQDWSLAGATLPMKSGTELPDTCINLKEFFNKTDAQQIYRCNGTGDGWTPIGGANLISAFETNLSIGSNRQAALIIDNAYYNEFNRLSELIFSLGIQLQPESTRTLLGGISAEYAEYSDTYGVGGALHLWTKSSTSVTPAKRITILPSGFVGINRTAPTAQLDVNGVVNANEFTINGGLIADASGINGAALPAFSETARGAVPPPGLGSTGARCLHDDGSWLNCGGGGGGVNGKGQLATHTGILPAILSPGDNNQVLAADSAAEPGLDYKSIKVRHTDKIIAASKGAASCYPGPGVSYPSSGVTCTHGAPTSTYFNASLGFADAATQCVTIHTSLHLDWDRSTPSLDWEWARSSGTLGAARWSIATAFLSDGADYSGPTFNATQFAQATPAGNSIRATTSLPLDMTGADPGDTVQISFCRIGGDTLDTLASLAMVYEWRLKYFISATLQ